VGGLVIGTRDREEAGVDGSRQTEPVPGPAGPSTGAPVRRRVAVAIAVLAALLIGGFFAASPGGVRTPLGEYLVAAAILAVAFWFPAMRVGSVRDVARQWKGIALWLLAWTAVWDVTSSGVFLRRQLFQEWWIVYPSGLVGLAALLLLHGTVMARIEGRGAAPADRGPMSLGGGGLEE
jgi:hypothetical protein